MYSSYSLAVLAWSSEAMTDALTPQNRISTTPQHTARVELIPLIALESEYRARAGGQAAHPLAGFPDMTRDISAPREKRPNQRTSDRGFIKVSPNSAGTVGAHSPLGETEASWHSNRSIVRPLQTKTLERLCKSRPTLTVDGTSQPSSTDASSGSVTALTGIAPNVHDARWSRGCGQAEGGWRSAPFW